MLKESPSEVEGNTTPDAGNPEKTVPIIINRFGLSLYGKLVSEHLGGRAEEPCGKAHLAVHTPRVLPRGGKSASSSLQCCSWDHVCVILLVPKELSSLLAFLIESPWSHSPGPKTPLVSG